MSDSDAIFTISNIIANATRSICIGFSLAVIIQCFLTASVGKRAVILPILSALLLFGLNLFSIIIDVLHWPCKGRAVSIYVVSYCSQICLEVGSKDDYGMISRMLIRLSGLQISQTNKLRILATDNLILTIMVYAVFVVRAGSLVALLFFYYDITSPSGLCATGYPLVALLAEKFILLFYNLINLGILAHLFWIERTQRRKTKMKEKGLLFFFLQQDSQTFILAIILDAIFICIVSVVSTPWIFSMSAGLANGFNTFILHIRYCSNLKRQLAALSEVDQSISLFSFNFDQSAHIQSATVDAKSIGVRSVDAKSIGMRSMQEERTWTGNKRKKSHASEVFSESGRRESGAAPARSAGSLGMHRAGLLHRNSVVEEGGEWDCISMSTVDMNPRRSIGNVSMQSSRKSKGSILIPEGNEPPVPEIPPDLQHSQRGVLGLIPRVSRANMIDSITEMPVVEELESRNVQSDTSHLGGARSVLGTFRDSRRSLTPSIIVVSTDESQPHSPESKSKSSSFPIMPDDLIETNNVIAGRQRMGSITIEQREKVLRNVVEEDEEEARPLP
ncbi:hypothetical protein HDU97_002502 [Phlyctochytrium planicorne]|nr:hypothetical protein HDU97_002502 [Phlyctochytrium planicorne]